jgi:hypothetical protein
LSRLPAGQGWKVINRTVTTSEKGGQPGVRFSDGNGVGIAWLENSVFTNGTIEFDVRGTNVIQMCGSW